MAESDFERTETAPPRRREEARNEGNVARSVDLSAAVTLLGAMLLLHLSLTSISGWKRILMMRM